MAGEVRVGRRITVYGPSGSGKSTLAEELGERLGLPVIDLDHVYHRGPTWDDDLTTEEFRAAVGELMAQYPDGWVIAGNYSTVRDLILPHAETAIWLDLPFLTVYRRLAWRTVSRAITGAELFNGNRESLKQTFLSRESMLLWGITAWKLHHRNLRAALAAPGLSARVYVLKTPGQARYLTENARIGLSESGTMPGDPTGGG
jgi:adenylate kinase family enzyme